MSDNDNSTRTRKPLGLKRAVDAGEVKQTFSHGRTNKVAVEVKRKRKILKPGETAPAAAPEAAPTPAAAPPAAPKPAAPKPAPRRPSPSDETPQERVARLQREAEEERLKMAEEARRREEEAKAKALEEERQRAEENRKAEAEAQKEAEAEVKETQEKPAPEVEAEKPSEQEDAAPTADGPAADGEEEGEAVPAPRKFTPVKRPEPKKVEKKPAADKKGGARDTRGDARSVDAKGADRRRGGKLTVNKALNDDEGARARSLAALKRAREKERRSQYRGQQQPREKQVRDVVVP
ncbi:MAG: translation initiation factor IF-2, partial [Croceicoccus sp.]|nr:translation initiation factor IF-2 [Croceicoccus sp.]